MQFAQLLTADIVLRVVLLYLSLWVQKLLGSGELWGNLLGVVNAFQRTTKTNKKSGETIYNITQNTLFISFLCRKKQFEASKIQLLETLRKDEEVKRRKRLLEEAELQLYLENSDKKVRYERVGRSRRVQIMDSVTDIEFR